MVEQLCPKCRCYIGVDAYEQEGVLYCCKPCATGGHCECGCCEIENAEERTGG